jgi:hypothetical protein
MLFRASAVGPGGSLLDKGRRQRIAVDAGRPTDEGALVLAEAALFAFLLASRVVSVSPGPDILGPAANVQVVAFGEG